MAGGPPGFQMPSDGVGAGVDSGVSISEEAAYKDGGADWRLISMVWREGMFVLCLWANDKVGVTLLGWIA